MTKIIPIGHKVRQAIKQSPGQFDLEVSNIPNITSAAQKPPYLQLYQFVLGAASPRVEKVTVTTGTVVIKT